MNRYERKVGIATRRIKEIRDRSSLLVKSFCSKSFSNPWLFGPLELTIGRLCTLTTPEINSLAKKLPVNACGLLSDEQLYGVEFSKFTGEQLDRMIGGDGTDAEATRRLGLLNAAQLKSFLDLSSGDHFRKFDDAFYRSLQLTAFSPEKIAAFFDDDFGRQRELATYHFRLVSADEVALALPSIPSRLYPMLSDAQIIALDFATITHEQFDGIFLAQTDFMDETLRRVRLIKESPKYSEEIKCRLNEFIAKSRRSTLSSL
jgi:hypothetical protein